MPHCCIVPKCKTGYKSQKVKRSVFKVPKDSERLKKWQAAIPGKKLTSSHFVCEKHFEEKYILRKYIKHDANGKVIAEVAFKHPHLHKSGIPTIFESNEQTFESMQKYDIVNALGNRVAASPSHNLSDVAINESSISISVEPVTETLGNGVAASPSHNSSDVAINKSSISITVEPVTEIIDMPIDVATEEANINLASTHMANGPIAVRNSVLANHDTTFNILSVATEDESSAHLDNSGDSSMILPMPWNVCQLSTRPDQPLIFLYTIQVKKQGIHTPINQRCVTLDEQQNLRYFIYGNLVNVDATNLVQKLDNMTTWLRYFVLRNCILHSFANETKCLSREYENGKEICCKKKIV